MPNSYFAFKQFTVYQDRCAMKVTTDACLFGAWCAVQLKESKRKTALDIGTGTGLLSMMIAQKNSLQIDAVEINEQASAQAGENIAASPWCNVIDVIHGDATQYRFNKKYDFIFTNPPFYENEIESSSKEKNMAHHSGGLTIEALLYLIHNLLTEDGYFYMLLPYKRFTSIKNQLKNAGLFVNQQLTVYHSAQHPPLRIIIEGSKKETTIQTGTLFIRDKDKQYTEPFFDLLKDYYLHL